MKLWCDGFDFYPYADITLGRMTGVSAGTTITTGGRNGTKSFRITADNAYGFKAVTPNSSTAIIHIAYKPSSISGQTVGFLSFYDASMGLVGVQIQVTATGAITAVFRSTGSATPGSFTSVSTLGTSSAGVITAGIHTHIQVKVVFHASAGSIEVRLNGDTTPVLTITGIQTKLSGSTSTYGWDGVYLHQRVTVGSITQDFDDFIIADGSGSQNNDFMGDCDIETTVMSAGNGSSADFTPSTGTDRGANVDDANQDGDSTYNWSSTVGHRDTYNHAALSLSGTVRSMQITTVAKKSDAGARSIAHSVKSGGSYYESSDLALSTSYTYQSTIREVDPATSAAWLTADVSATEIGQKVTV